MRRVGLLSTLLLVVVLLTGCLTPKVNFTIHPDPITITAGQTELTGITLRVRLSGFSFAYLVEEAVVTLEDDKSEEVLREIVEINTQIPIIGGLGKDVDLPDISLEGLADLNELVYDEVLKGKDYQLKITLTGKNPTSAQAVVQFR